MKRSFYEMLEIARDADQARIDIAYAHATARLSSVASRGAADAVIEAQLIRKATRYSLIPNDVHATMQNYSTPNRM